MEKQGRVIDEILNQLTPEKIQKEIQEIQEIELPLDLQKWIDEYEKVGQRNRFFWKWTFNVSKTTIFSTILPEHQESLRNVKFLISMFIVLIDDVVDKTHNVYLLKKILGHIEYEENTDQIQLNNQDEEYLKLTLKTWNHIQVTIKKYPGFEEFEELFKHDVSQALNTMKYAHLISAIPQLINEKEYWLYSPHSMQVMICSTLELMCSSGFNIKNLGKLREILWSAQKMARIGNCLSTLKREIKENDFTGGIVAYAVNNEIVSVDDLKNLDKAKLIQKIEDANIREVFLKKWDNEYRQISKKILGTQEKEGKNLLITLEKLLFWELISENYK